MEICGIHISRLRWTNWNPQDFFTPIKYFYYDLEHVASPSVELCVVFLNAIGYTPEKEDRANRLLSMETRLGWFRDTGFVEVDCYWKWLEMALLIGYKAWSANTLFRKMPDTANLICYSNENI